jgi:predicted permease
MSLSTVWEQSLQDGRYAVRVMARQPVFTTMALLSLALGIGANTAIFSFMDAILMRALPVRHPESLVVLRWSGKDRPPVVHSLNGTNYRDPNTGYTSGNFPYQAYEHLAGDNASLASLFAFKGAGRLNVIVQGQADLAEGQYVSGTYFGGLGVLPAAGRLLDAADDRADGQAVVVLGFQYAQRRFGDVATSVGQLLLINNTPFTVAGVAAPGFFGVDPALSQDVYLPMRVHLAQDPAATQNPNRYWVEMMGRLRPGVTRDQAQAALAPAFRNVVESTASTEKERIDLPSLSLEQGAGGLDFLRRQYSRPLYVLMAMVGLILAIACANIANLLLAHATARRREMALRLGLGAGRSRIVRQLLTESVLLALLGGLLGLAFAGWGIRALTLLIGNGRENFTLHAALNWNVLATTVALSFVTGILFGLAPAIRSIRVDLNAALKQTPAGEHSPASSRWARLGSSQVLVISQIAISLVLLVGAGLFVRTLANLNAIQLGFNDERVLLFTVNAMQAGYRDETLVRFYEGLQDRLKAIPGVQSVSSSNYALVSGSVSSTAVRVPGIDGPGRGTSVLSVGPAFFSTMQIPILAGREVDDRDVRRGAAVAVVNEEFARTYFANESPVGRHFQLSISAPVDLEIVGVSKTARYNSLKGDIPPVVYVPYSLKARPIAQMTYELRAAGNPLALVAAVRQVVGQADSRVPIANIVTQRARIDQTISQERTFAALCAVFAVLAVLIACVGLYGTMAYSVARRTSEFGIRMALGAGRPQLIMMVLRQVLVLAVSGLGIGLLAALAVTRVVESFLFRIEPNDPLALSLAALILLAASLLAGYGPARKASRVDPWTALRAS